VGFVTSVENGTPTKELVESTTYEVNLSQGTAVVILPNDFSNDDVVEVISVVTKHSSKFKH
jgi:CTP-dependent riboflavin kinase